MNDQSSVYKIVNNQGKILYVGRTNRDVEKRFNEHKKNAALL